MIKWVKQLDCILRGDSSPAAFLDQGQFSMPMGGVAAVAASLGIIYGACMGLYTVLCTGGQAYMQLIASAVKLPALFFLTLLVTFPSLYVFSALLGSRLNIRSNLRLILASMGVMLAVLASLGPIVVFFTISTTSYPFMVLLNTIVGTVAGVLGLVFMLRIMTRLVALPEEKAIEQPVPVEPVTTSPDSPPPLPAPRRRPDVERHQVRAQTVFRVWMIVFALVGAQMSWVLRPFIGNPAIPFEWFRPREGNFFLAMLGVLNKLFS